MSENIRSTNLRFNLEKDTQKRAWQYLQNMDKQQFKSYSNTSFLSIFYKLIDCDFLFWQFGKYQQSPR